MLMLKSYGIAEF